MFDFCPQREKPSDPQEEYRKNHPVWKRFYWESIARRTFVVESKDNDLVKAFQKFKDEQEND